MSEFYEIQSEIKAVKVALRSFGDYENEEERKRYLRQNFKRHPELRTYFHFTEQMLQDEKKRLEEKENQLLFQDNLERYLLKEPVATNDSYFPPSGVGKYLLPRRNVVEMVMTEIKTQLQRHPSYTRSVYLHGCRGTGKSTYLRLIGKELKNEGYLVYYFPSVGKVPRDADLRFFSMAKEGKKVAVLIDEAYSVDLTGIDIFIHLLKSTAPNSNLVTVAAAVPRCISYNFEFRKVVSSSDLLLNNSDEDFQGLVKHWEGTKTATPEMTTIICNLLLEHCGGHIYPSLALMEYFLGNVEVGNELELKLKKNALVNQSEFKKFLGSAEFSASPFYQALIDSCFTGMGEQVFEVAARVARCQQQPRDIDMMARMGWWIDGRFISTLLVNVCLNCCKTGPQDSVLRLRTPSEMEDAEIVQDENAEFAIVEGLAEMVEADFCCDSNPRVEAVKLVDGVSFSWASRVKSRIANAHISFQVSSDVSGRVDCYLDGNADCAIEILLDASKTRNENATSASQDNGQHLNRLLSETCPWKRFVLLNFSITDKAVVLPNEETHSDINFRNRIYTFVYKDNTLYKGNVPIRAPAVRSLPCPKPLDALKKGRTYSTLARAGFKLGGVGLGLKRFLKFL